jgi:GDP-L-fucose synthase
MASEIIFPLADRKIYVAGHRGMVGSALVRRLRSIPCEIVTADSGKVDLRRQADTEHFIATERPEVVFVAAAAVGGILANNTNPARFLYDNLMIEANLIEAARQNGVKKLLFLGSSCIYPRMAKQPIAEEELLRGPLEETNQWYSIAKIAGLKLCAAYRRQYGCDFISAQPTNLYGPGDNFDLQRSHVLPALLAKAHHARDTGAHELEIWGSGKPKREFLHVDDLADALIFLMERYSGESHINIGYGEDISIDQLANFVAEIVGFQGQLRYDSSKPDGTPRKLLDSSRIRAMGWQPQIDLRTGLTETYEWYVANMVQALTPTV